MGVIYTELMEFMKKPAVVETLVDVLLCTVPIWVAVVVGLVIGWSWRPRWTGLVFLGLRSKLRFIWTAPPGFGARRLWFAFTALSTFSVCRRLWSNFRSKGSVAAEDVTDAGRSGVRMSSTVGEISSSFSFNNGTSEKDVVTEKDLEHLLHLLDGKVGEVAWQNQMERITSNMIYQAWRLEPESAPIVYRSKTIFEDATPELVRDFFWDDEFRCKWDNMLAYYKILEEFPQNGNMIVHWIKKFPFFCSDREYIIGRRIWESWKTYYCVTKDHYFVNHVSEPLAGSTYKGCRLLGIPYPSIPKNEKLRRVELYFSSWCIRAVESRKQDGQLSACEVSLVHYEDMGIPKDVAKMGVRHGMWGTVKKLHSGMRAYQLLRNSSEAPLSRCAIMAHITTNVSIDGVGPSNTDDSSLEEVGQEVAVASDTCHGPDWKWLIIGGVAIVWGLQTGIVGKTLLFGAARRLARR